jgi:hypothetical protein
LVSAHDVCAYLEGKESIGGSAAAAASSPMTNLHRAPGWLQGADAAALRDFSQKGYKLWCATVGPGDCIYIPCGFVGTHKVVGNTNLLGLRVGVATSCDVEMLRALKVSHEKAGKTAITIDQALDYLAGNGTVVATVAEANES